MEKKRFNKIMDVLISQLKYEIGICRALERANYLDIILDYEYKLIKQMLNFYFSKMKEEEHTYLYNGKYSKDGIYRFMNDSDRTKFLNELKVI